MYEILKGKLETKLWVSLKYKSDLVYRLGVVESHLAIKEDINKSFDLTRRWNTMVVVIDDAVVLWLGHIGAKTGMLVMEGECVLFKAFGDVDDMLLCIKNNDPDVFISTSISYQIV